MPKRKSDDSRLVYSTDGGRVRPERTENPSGANSNAASPNGANPGDGIVRLHRESKGRGGKAVTLIKGLPLAGNDLKALAKTLKKKCGVGGAVKDGVIEIQGDQRDVLKGELEKLGHTVKIAGG